MSLTLAAPTPTIVSSQPMCCGRLMQDKESFITQTVFQVCGHCHKNNYSQRSYEGRTKR